MDITKPCTLYKNELAEAFRLNFILVLWIPYMAETVSIYTLLTVGDRTQQIRLLHLHPGRLDEDLHCTLKVVDYEAPLESYDALSYTWGSEEPAYNVTVNGQHQLKIRKSLYTALRCLRQLDVMLTLWVDALCIDQSNVRERSAQVGKMGHIFKNASSVLVWVGMPKHHDTDDLNMMSRIYYGQSYSACGDAIENAICTSEPRWSDRQWVIQEFVLAAKIDFCFGRMRLPYKKVDLMDLVLSSELPNVRALHEATSDMTKLRLKLSDGPLSITDTALWASQAAASDPRDKVFSLLNLIHAREASIIGSDYSLTTEQVYARATFASVIVQQSMKALELVDFNSSRYPALPSWAANFDNTDLPIHFASDSFEFGTNLPKTCIQLSTAFNLESDCRCLNIVNAIRLDSIVNTLSLDGYRKARQGLSFAQQVMSFLRNALLNRPIIDEFEYLDIEIDEDYMFRTDALDILFGDDMSSLEKIIQSFFAWWNNVMNFHAPGQTIGHDIRKAATAFNDLYIFWEYANFATGSAVLFTTAAGAIGLGPGSLTVADEIIVLRESKMPMVVRADDIGQGTYYFHGFAYVHGIMEGELLEQKAFQHWKLEARAKTYRLQ